MNRFWYCCIFGHKWRRWGGQFKYGSTTWRRTLHAECQRCGHHVAEDRQAISMQAGTLAYIKGGYVGAERGN